MVAKNSAKVDSWHGERLRKIHMVIDSKVVAEKFFAFHPRVRRSLVQCSARIYPYVSMSVDGPATIPK